MRYHLIVLVFVIAAATELSAQPMYRLQENGNIWVNTGQCSATLCSWQLLDSNPNTREITASGVPAGGFDSIKAPPDAPALYKRHEDGTIWLYRGRPCSGALCWQMLGNDQHTVSIVAAGFPDPDRLRLYQRKDDGAIWRYTGKPCSKGLCLGWEKLDNADKDTLEILAAGDQLYKRYSNAIWRFTGEPCSKVSCKGWEKLDNNDTLEITAGMQNIPGKNAEGMQNTAPVLYQRRVDNTIWRYTGKRCDGAFCPGWEQIDNTSTISIVTGGNDLYQMRDDFSIWRYTGPGCSGASCWQRLDKNPRSRQIAAGPASLYQLHDNGMIWRYTGPRCSGESCWQRLDNPATRTIVSSRN